MSQSSADKNLPDSLGLLAGGVAHDFNNLLMAILGNADLALDEIPLESKARSSISEIHAVALRAADLCQQMLIYSGHGNFNLQTIELNHLASGLVPLMESIMPPHVSLRQNLSPGTIFINADFTRIQQMLLNLVTNASEAMHQKEGLITIETGVGNFDAKTLQKGVRNNPPLPDKYVFLRVSDTGSGMDQETKNRLFDPFFTTKFAGRGLGLSVVLGITRGHKGTILVDTEPGGGSSFTVLLPEAKRPSETSKTPEKVEAVDSAWKPKGLVLLADDEPDVRRVASRMLKKIGFEVMLALDGEEAVAIYSENTDIIDLVVLDLTMPRLGGQEALQRIRKITPDIPVLLSSGYSENRIPSESEGFIQKPYTLARFKDALRRISRESSD